jgi:opacity protein-like surface antigen
MVTRNKSITASAILLVVVLVSAAGFGQTPQPVQIAANTVAPPPSKQTADITPTTSALQARIESQQQEINKLTALVEKLQATLEPVASTHAVLPGSSIGFMPYPGGAPSPSPSPAPPPVSAGYTAPRELLPDIGQIGAQLGFFVGGATNPYKNNTGFASGGYIDLPWKNVPAGKLSYEIMIGLQRSVTTQTSTSGVNVVVNTALNNYLVEAGLEPLPTLTNYLAGPLPALSQTVQERAKVLTVAPFELKYAVTKLGRFRPYAVGGLGAYVWIGSDNNASSFNANTALGSLAGLPVGTSTLGATLNALLQGSQIGGLAPTSPELAARGVPHGQGNIMFGGQVGGGVDVRITPRLSIGADFRHDFVEGKNSGFSTFAFKQGLNW